jgi:ATP phosphoribosyltransferase regulatory subunit
LAEGGRYDQLLGLYDPQGKSSPGIGFSLYIEDLHSCLLATDKLPQQTPTSDCIIIPTTAKVEAIALKYARQLRNKDDSARIEIDLGERSEAAIKQYAKTCRIKQLIWIEEDGSPRIEILD